jgi:hypothetical protein
MSYDKSNNKAATGLSKIRELSFGELEIVGEAIAIR